MGVPRSGSTISRPPVSWSSMATSSATRSGLLTETIGPSQAIRARWTTCDSAPAQTAALGEHISGAKWCSDTDTKSKPASSAARACSRAQASMRWPDSAANAERGTGNGRPQAPGSV
ncbi:MAG TPA: hypothetical protein VGM79_19895 [Streptosporangiaceae bacterium]